MAATSEGARQLAQRLRDLRTHTWRDVRLTQAQLARALSSEGGHVASSTVSSWESLTSPKTPTRETLTLYARFFSAGNSAEGTPHLIPVDSLKGEEVGQFRRLEQELHDLLEGAGPAPDVGRRLLSFDRGPVVIICPEVPKESRGGLAAEDDINFTRLHQYADADALIEVFGHIRALNPEIHVHHRLPRTIASEQLQNHLVVLGGIGWNPTTRRILKELEKKLPVEQIEGKDLANGEVFRVTGGDGEVEIYYPETVKHNGVEELEEDVALLARLPNPFNSNCTLTICNGVYSRGVLGAVLTVTDETVGPANERYIAQRFAEDVFAMLVKVPVVSRKVLAPDLWNEETRLFEWPGSPHEEEG